jgi:hypothetical protein
MAEAGVYDAGLAFTPDLPPPLRWLALIRGGAGDLFGLLRDRRHRRDRGPPDPATRVQPD